MMKTTTAMLIMGTAMMFTACATTTGGMSDTEVTGVINKMVSVTADELENQDPMMVSDCAISVAMSQIALRDSQTEDENMVMNLQFLVWEEVQNRQEASGISVPSSLVDDFNGDADAEAVAMKITEKTISCTETFTEGMKAATAKLKAEG